MGISIETDSIEFLEMFNDDYSWYKSTSFNVDKRLNCLVNLNNDEKDTFARINDRDYPLNGHPNKYSYVYGTIVNPPGGRGYRLSIDPFRGGSEV